MEHYEEKFLESLDLRSVSERTKKVCKRLGTHLVKTHLNEKLAETQIQKSVMAALKIWKWIRNAKYSFYRYHHHCREQ